MSDWAPSASLPILQARAELNRLIRQFFLERGVLEVETPLLGQAIGSDPALEPLSARFEAFPGADAHTLYLQTSPEFAMKRLLAAGTGAIYQLGKAFRNGESGTRHNPEFTMLEWYRPGFSLNALMAETGELADTVLGTGGCRRASYAALFDEHLGIDPHTCETAALQALVHAHLDIADAAPDRATCLELLFSHCIEGQLQAPVMVHDFPREQAALARLATDGEGREVARRFELIIGGMEIANGYDELVDPGEQRQRFAADRSLRSARGLPLHRRDDRLLAALDAGMPASSGVALGVDRLLMLKTGATSIDEVLAFPLARA